MYKTLPRNGLLSSLRDGRIPSLRFSDYNNDCQMEMVEYHSVLRFYEIRRTLYKNEYFLDAQYYRELFICVCYLKKKNIVVITLHLNSSEMTFFH